MKSGLLGEAASPVDADVIYDTPFESGAITYARVEGLAPLVDATHAHVLDRLGPGVRAVSFTADGDDALGALGRVIADRYGLAAPRRAVAHRNYMFGYHSDVTNPYPCINATMFFRHDCAGGALIFPELRIGVAAHDGWVAIFDGQILHGVTMLEPWNRDAYRVSLCYYCPTP